MGIKMTLRKLTLFSLFLLLGTTAFAQNYSPQTADDDGCYFPPSSYSDAISSTAVWSEYTEDKLTVKHSNISNGRVYARFCNQRSNGTWDCGASGISANRTHNWTTYNATGRYKIRWIGSNNPSKDWVCAGKVSNWNDD